MKTLKKQIEEQFSRPFTGHPSREPEHDIEQMKQAILKLAQAIDNIVNQIL